MYLNDDSLSFRDARGALRADAGRGLKSRFGEGRGAQSGGGDEGEEMTNLTITIDMGRKCEECRKGGAVASGLCLSCTSRGNERESRWKTETGPLGATAIQQCSPGSRGGRWRRRGRGRVDDRQGSPRIHRPQQVVASHTSMPMVRPNAMETRCSTGCGAVYSKCDPRANGPAVVNLATSGQDCSGNRMKL